MRWNSNIFHGGVLILEMYLLNFIANLFLSSNFSLTASLCVGVNFRKEGKKNENEEMGRHMIQK